MLGKIDQFMYATNHAEETAKNLKKVSEWVKSKVGSNNGSSATTTTPEPSTSTAPSPSVTTTPQATHTPTADATATIQHTTVSQAPVTRPVGFWEWFLTDASMTTRMVIIAITIIVLVTVTITIRHWYRSWKQRRTA
jgi:hypothetical protein